MKKEGIRAGVENMIEKKKKKKRNININQEAEVEKDIGGVKVLQEVKVVIKKGEIEKKGRNMSMIIEKIKAEKENIVRIIVQVRLVLVQIIQIIIIIILQKEIKIKKNMMI